MFNGLSEKLALISFCICFFSCTTVKVPLHTQSALEALKALEANLVPAVVFSDTSQKYSLAERMKHYRVPAVSFAVIQGGKIILAKTYGVKQSSSREAANEHTLFQAASVSKPIAALGALALVEEGKLQLDKNVNFYLRDWKVPESIFTHDKKVTLRRILSHTAGLNVGGFMGYRQDEHIPSAVQILSGLGNSPRVVSSTFPGHETRYSGGGTLIAQVMMENVSNEPFAQLMERVILRPLGMHDSLFASSIPSSLTQQIAAGHTQDGKTLEGLYRRHPELAPAGLWTTAKDLAKSIVALQESYCGHRNNLPLSQKTVHEMLSVQGQTFGLGPKISKNGNYLIFQHEGSNVGYKALWMGFLDASKAQLSESGGFVALANSDTGFELILEIYHAVAKIMGWQFLLPEQQKMSFKTLTLKERAMVGIFESNGEEYYLTENDGVLNFNRRELYKIDNLTFIDEQGIKYIFKPLGKKSIEIESRVGQEKTSLRLKRK